MIAFGISINGAEAYRRYGQPGINLAVERNSEIYAFAGVETTGRTYNLILDAAQAHDDLEALVLVHPNTEIVDPDFCAKVRRALSDPDVGVVGSAGATGVRSIAWWEGSVVCAPITQRYGEYGGGELPGLSWVHTESAPAEVESLDGQLLVLSPWVARNVRFDEAPILDHGFDVDFSLQVRAAGRKLVVADFRVTHHRSLELIPDLEIWSEAHVRLADKWDGALSQAPADEEGWKRRARLAEARREAARANAFSEALKLDARVLELERDFAEKLDSVSWRLTAPLRTVNRWRKAAARRRSAR